MGWGSAIKKKSAAPSITNVVGAKYELAKVDWDRLVTLDFETYYDPEYTLKKMSTSEYVRDPRFKAQMVGIKIGNKKTRTFTGAAIARELKKINWATHSLLAHNTAFDGLILSHHYGIVPLRYYDTLSMARGLHSNEIGAGLDEVALFYGGQGKIQGALESTLGVLNWSKQLTAAIGAYCERDVDECFRIFTEMHKVFPANEMQLVHLTIRMFCDPVLRVDIPRVQAEYEREVVKRKEAILAAVPDPSEYDTWDEKGRYHGVLDKKSGRDTLEGDERHMAVVKKVVGSNEKFVDLLTRAGLPEEAIPRKISPAWMKLDKEEREAQIDRKWSYAFAKDDLDFVDLPERVWDVRPDLDPEDPADILRATAIQGGLRHLVDVRLAVKSTTNITRAERFLEAGRDGMKLPVGYSYHRAHTGRFGGNNKMNMQNLTRGGELRLSILADKGHAMAVCDSGQIEARVNGWLWGQEDLLEAFRKSDAYEIEGKGRDMHEDERDAYCRFADVVYGRTIWKADKMERFVGKVCVAEGELVLTDRGLVPINLLSLEDRLWDGIEWVPHDGLIDQGIKEVITYDGLTATPDHEVFTEDGRIIPLGQAASEMARLQTTGDQGRGVRFCDHRVVADTPRQRLSVRQGAMRPDWYYQADIAEQLTAGENDIVSEKREAACAARGDIGSTVRRDPCAMQQPKQPAVAELRGAGGQAPVQLQDGLHPVGLEVSPAPALPGCGDRPNRQRWGLRAGESAAGHTPTTDEQSALHSEGLVARPAGTAGRVPQPAEPDSHRAPGQERDDGRTDSGACQAERDIQTQELALHRRQARVFDIANAGPRRRFTVSGKLVLNCVLGLGYQMGVDKFQMTLAKGALGGPRVNFPRDQCAFIVNAYRSTNYKIAQGWKQCSAIIEDMALGVSGAHKCISWGGDGDGNGWVLLPNGMSLKYPNLRKARNEEKGFEEWTYQSGEMRKKIYGGLLCENLVQALARIIVAEQMLMIDKKYRCVMTTHDEVVAHPKLREAEKCYQFMYQCMTTPLWWCPDIPLTAEGGWAENYSK